MIRLLGLSVRSLTMQYLASGTPNPNLSSHYTVSRKRDAA